MKYEKEFIEMTKNLDKEIQLMQVIRKNAIQEWRAFDLVTIERIIEILEKQQQRDCETVKK